MSTAGWEFLTKDTEVFVVATTKIDKDWKCVRGGVAAYTVSMYLQGVKTELRVSNEDEVKRRKN